MALTNAERQARHRKRQSAKLALLDQILATPNHHHRGDDMTIHQVRATTRKYLNPKEAAEALFAKRAAPKTVAPRILEDAPKPVVVETRRSRGAAARAAAALAKPIDHAVVAAVAAAGGGGGNGGGEHDKVYDLVAAGLYEQAAKLAAKLINGDNDLVFFAHGATEEFGLVDKWFRRQVRESQRQKSSAFCELTPELAQVLLLNNKGNRRVNSANLGAIMRDMASGRWAANGETIIVSKDGLLNDGQHRCFAALITGVSIETAVAFGVERDSIATVDIGRKRTGADRLGIGGVPNYVPMSAISNLIIEMKTGRSATPAETDAFFFENRELIETAHSAAGTNMKGVGPSAAGAAAAYLINLGHKKADVSAFFAAVRSGEMMPKRDPRMILHKSIFDGRFKIKLSRDNWVRAFVVHFIAHKNGKTTQAVTWDIALDWSL